MNVRRIDEPPTREALAAATKTLREVLAELAERGDPDALVERVDELLRSLPKRPWVLDALERVVGKSKTRRRDSIFVLVTLGGVDRLVPLLNDPSVEIRREAIRALFGQRSLHLAPVLAERLRVEDDEACRNVLIFACGELRTPETLDALLAAAAEDREEERHRILFHLRRHEAEAARTYFETVFARESNEPKVLAAWGLAKLGSAPDAHAFLVKMLDDTRVVHIREGQVSGVEPGLSERAAQALADVRGIAFRWGKGDVPKIRKRVSTRS